MKKIIIFSSAFLMFLLTSMAKATMATVVLEENPPVYASSITLDELFGVENQKKFIINDLIQFDQFSYPVNHSYSIKEQQWIWQQCEKFLYNDWETKAYMYQFIVKPYPHPILKFEPIPEPITIGILGLGGFCLLLIKRGTRY